VKVEVVRSARRRKTVQARQVGGVLRVSIPASMTVADEQHWVAEMVRRMERRAATEGADLGVRAAVLAERYDLPRPTVIRWVNNQEGRWGSCTPADRTVRISSRLVGEPAWVLDYVIVHELAHLVVPRHDARFWKLVHRYPRADLARGFLIARSVDPGLDPDLDPIVDPDVDDLAGEPGEASGPGGASGSGGPSEASGPGHPRQRRQVDAHHPLIQPGDRPPPTDSGRGRTLPPRIEHAAPPRLPGF
jgi:predicted metal-dependent hydrolase